jgi:S1-C subfamily serine protease
VKTYVVILAVTFSLELSTALGQNMTRPPSNSPATMPTTGAPLKDTSTVNLPPWTTGVDSEIPTLQLSRIAHIPMRDFGGTTRSAKDAAIYRALSPSVVLIATKDGLGSGSLVSTAGEVITSWHVIDGYSYVAVVFKPAVEGMEAGRDDMKLGRVVKVDEVADLALVKVDDAPPRQKPHSSRRFRRDQCWRGCPRHRAPHW